MVVATKRNCIPEPFRSLTGLTNGRTKLMPPAAELLPRETWNFLPEAQSGAMGSPDSPDSTVLEAMLLASLFDCLQESTADLSLEDACPLTLHGHIEAITRVPSAPQQPTKDEQKKIPHRNPCIRSIKTGLPSDQVP